MSLQVTAACFLLLQLEAPSQLAKGEEPGRLIPPVRFRSLYGDLITL